MPIDSEIHFGASTRRYVIRERPQAKTLSAYSTDETSENLFGLPETETELDVSLTMKQHNTLKQKILVIIMV